MGRRNDLGCFKWLKHVSFIMFVSRRLRNCRGNVKEGLKWLRKWHKLDCFTQFRSPGRIWVRSTWHKQGNEIKDDFWTWISIVDLSMESTCRINSKAKSTILSWNTCIYTMDWFAPLDASFVSTFHINKLLHVGSRVYGEKKCVERKKCQKSAWFSRLWTEKKEWEVFWSYLAFFSPSALAMKTTIE